MAVSQLEPQSLRRQVGYVPQDVVLFHGDIRENVFDALQALVRMIKTEVVTETEVESLIKRAGAARVPAPARPAADPPAP